MDEFRTLLAYNRWATLRFLDAAEALGPEAAGREIASSFSSLIATLRHMAGAEWVWLERWNGTSPTAFPAAEGLVDLAALRAFWHSVWEGQQAFLDALPDGAQGQEIAYANMAGTPDARPLGELIRHVVNHGTYHRGQLTTMLRQLDGTPPSTDYVRYLREVSD